MIYPEIDEVPDRVLGGIDEMLRLGLEKSEGGKCTRSGAREGAERSNGWGRKY